MSTQKTGAADVWLENNFDLLRLAAALQVFTTHAIPMLKVSGVVAGAIDSVLRFFPGVPIFFVISGFLISKSLERSSSITEYYRNRCLRIMPGLWVCLIISVGVILIAGVDAIGPVSPYDWLVWWAAQMTAWQQYDPQFLRPLGSGILNSALWTIPVELEFYALLPVIYAACRLRERRGTLSLCAIAVASLVAQFLLLRHSHWPWGSTHSIVIVTVIPYLWMFLVGVLAQRHWATVQRLFTGQAHRWLMGYALLCLVLPKLHIRAAGADTGPAVFLPLAGLVISLAVSAPQLAGRLLHHQDISYGTYIYHLLVVNLLIQFGVPGTALSLAIALSVTVSLATLSWILVERPFLLQKRRSLHLPVEA